MNSSIQKPKKPSNLARIRAPNHDQATAVEMDKALKIRSQVTRIRKTIIRTEGKRKIIRIRAVNPAKSLRL